MPDEQRTARWTALKKELLTTSPLWGGLAVMLYGMHSGWALVEIVLGAWAMIVVTALGSSAVIAHE